MDFRVLSEALSAPPLSPADPVSSHGSDDQLCVDGSEDWQSSPLSPRLTSPLGKHKHLTIIGPILNTFLSSKLVSSPLSSTLGKQLYPPLCWGKANGSRGVLNR